MRKVRAIISYCLCLLLVVSSVASASAEVSPAITKSTRVAGNAYIPAGTSIGCELITSLYSGRNSVNDPVMFKTIEAIIINGVTVIPVGAVGQAVVSDVRRAGSFGKGGRVTISTRTVRAINGAYIPVTFDMTKAGGTEGWVVPAFLLVSILAGFAKGKDQNLPSGTRFNVAVSSDYDLGTAVEQLAEVMVDPNRPVQKQKPPAAVQEIMTIQQTADYLQVSPDIVWQMIQEGKLKAVMIGDQYRIRKSDIDNIR